MATRSLLDLRIVQQNREHGQLPPEVFFDNLTLVALFVAGAALLLLVLTTFESIA